MYNDQEDGKILNGSSLPPSSMTHPYWWCTLFVYYCRPGKIKLCWKGDGGPSSCAKSTSELLVSSVFTSSRCTLCTIWGIWPKMHLVEYNLLSALQGKKKVKTLENLSRFHNCSWRICSEIWSNCSDFKGECDRRQQLISFFLFFARTEDPTPKSTQCAPHIVQTVFQWIKFPCMVSFLQT